MVNVAILGFGVVGSGAAEVLAQNGTDIEKKLGTEIAVKRILDLRDFPDSPFGHLVTHDFNDILNDADISIVAEGRSTILARLYALLHKDTPIDVRDGETLSEIARDKYYEDYNVSSYLLPGILKYINI
jgi:homoserine dehydrogenase